MRSALLVSLASLLLVLPAPAEKPPRKEALAAITTILKELPLGTPFEVVTKRDGFEYFEELELWGTKVEGVAVFAQFHEKKLSQLSLHDLNYVHPQLLELLEKSYGKPETRKSGPRTSHVFKKDGAIVATLNFSRGTMTDLQLGGLEK